MTRHPIRPALPPALALCAAAILAACGGGGGDSSPATPPVTTGQVTTRVIDGPIGNALVCLDLDDSGGCDAGEPSARTAADGSATLTAETADLARHALVAVVGTDAVDAATGPVATAYTMTTSVGRPEVVSPLTTLVKRRIDLAGLTADAAEKSLQNALGQPLSFHGDYLRDASPDAAARGALARVLVAATQRMNAALRPALGTTATDGAAIRQPDLDRAVADALIDNLGVVVGAGALDPTLTAAEAARLAQNVVADHVGLTAGNVGVVVAAARSRDTTPAQGASAGYSTDWFSYADADNWSFRLFASTAAQNVPDAAGLLHFTDERKRAVAGAVQRWGDDAWHNTQASFAGGAWTVCPATFVNDATPRTAQGLSESLYCGAYRSSSVRSVVDVSGKSMAEVVATIRAYPLPSTSGSYPSWGPDPASPALAGASFPDGSKLLFQKTTQLANPDVYDTVASNVVSLYAADVAAGGTPQFDSAGQTDTPCGRVTNGNSASLVHAVATLEEMASLAPGKPCVFAANATTGPRNEWWGNTTLSIGDVAAPAPDLPFYAAARRIRLSFGAGNSVSYWSCARRASDGSPRNCDPIGTGTWSIETAGDARLMRFAGVPAQAGALNFERVFVEREGRVWYGFRTRLAVNNSVRLNAPAFDALLGRLALSR